MNVAPPTAHRRTKEDLEKDHAEAAERREEQLKAKKQHAAEKESGKA